MLADETKAGGQEEATALLVLPEFTLQCGAGRAQGRPVQVLRALLAQASQGQGHQLIRGGQHSSACDRKIADIINSRINPLKSYRNHPYTCQLSNLLSEENVPLHVLTHLN